jgi:hypothetical protein
MLASADLRVSGDAVLGRSVRRAWYLDELLLGRRSPPAGGALVLGALPRLMRRPNASA